VEKRVKNSTPKLQLNKRDSEGLLAKAEDE
jgi:hypothetical protein